MKRGQIVTIAGGPGFGGKPRPALIIQDDAYLDISTVLVAIISSDARAADSSLSVGVVPSEENGLRKQSYIMTHDLVTIRTEKCEKLVGELENELMRRVDRALILFLGLDR